MVDYKTKIIGTRNGEKLYESLLTKEEMSYCLDLGNYFRIPAQSKDLDYSRFFENGNKKHSEFSQQYEYNSHNVENMEVEQVVELLNSLENSFKVR